MNEDIEKRLTEYVAVNVASAPDHVRKVACLVWFDKLSSKVGSAAELTGIRLLVHTTPCHVPYDPQSVVNTLVEVFGYGAGRAWRRVVSGVQSRANKERIRKEGLEEKQ